MYTRPPNLYFHTGKLLLLGLLLCIFTAGTALAVKPTDKPCKGSKCDTPLPASADIYAFWGDDELSSVFFEYIPEGSDSRTCTLTQLAADFSSGTYDCQLNDFPVDYAIDMVPSVNIYARGNDWYCGDGYDDGYDTFSGIPDLQYSYSWTGNCKDPAGCDVTIINRIGMDYQPTVMYQSITIEAFAEGVTTSDIDGNPFNEAQNLSINRLLVTKFAPTGKSKILAICESFPDPDMVTFHTSLAPVTPE